MSKPGPQSVEAENRAPASRAPRALMGTYSRNLDPKRRLTIPSVWRAALGPDFVYVMPDPKRRCLQLLAQDAMEARIAKYREMALGDAEINAALDAIGAASELLEFDVQGRIRINDDLLAYANLKGSVVLKGGVRMATIWPAEKSEEDISTRVEKLGDALAKLNF